MTKLWNAFLVVLCLLLATIAVAGPSILSVIQGGTGLNAVAAHQLFVGTASNTFTAKTIPDCPNSGGNRLNYAQTGDTFTCGSGAGGSGFDPNNVTLFDEFVGGSATQALGWTSNGGGGSVTVQPNGCSAANHPGCMEVAAGVSSWEYYILGLNNVGGEELNPQAQTFKWYFRANNQNGATSGTIRVGMFDNRGLQNATTAVYFEAGTARANTDWWCIQENSSSITSADSGIVSASGSTYHTLELDAAATTSVTWKIDGSTVCGGIGGTNLPNTNLTIAAEASGTGTAPKIWLDYFRLDLTTTGR